jgi:hypothetical protein
VSGQVEGAEIDLAAVNGEGGDDGGVVHGAALVAFVEAVMGDTDDSLDSAREALRGRLSPEAFVDACAVVGAFNVVDRIADSTGIPLDDALATMSSEVRSELGLARFASSANTPEAGE